MPDGVGGPRLQAPQALLLLLVLREFRLAAEDVVRRGEVLITPKRWAELADEAGVARQHLARVLEAWLAAECAVLAAGRHAHCFRLGSRFGPEARVIHAGGLATIEGRERQRRRSARR
jgi:hypothetical protein